jgi:hypothetical protein
MTSDKPKPEQSPSKNDLGMPMAKAIGNNQNDQDDILDEISEAESIEIEEELASSSSDSILLMDKSSIDLKAKAKSFDDYQIDKSSPKKSYNDHHLEVSKNSDLSISIAEETAGEISFNNYDKIVEATKSPGRDNNKESAEKEKSDIIEEENTNSKKKNEEVNLSVEVIPDDSEIESLNESKEDDFEDDYAVYDHDQEEKEKEEGLKNSHDQSTQDFDVSMSISDESPGNIFSSSQVLDLVIDALPLPLPANHINININNNINISSSDILSIKTQSLSSLGDIPSLTKNIPNSESKDTTAISSSHKDSLNAQVFKFDGEEDEDLYEFDITIKDPVPHFTPSSSGPSPNNPTVSHSQPGGANLNRSRTSSSSSSPAVTWENSIEV